MTIYVLGAGASYHAGYPLCSSMGPQLIGWMKAKVNVGGFESRYPTTAQFFEEQFGEVKNIEDMFTEIQELIEGWERGTPDQMSQRTVVANEQSVLVNAIRSWFIEIRQRENAAAYRRFAEEILHPDDCIITFNYDVSLDRELKMAGKFEVGDGYGFEMKGLPSGSLTKLLKLHGSTSWLALIFGGATSGYAQFWPGNTLGDRPVIGSDEFTFLGYRDLTDPAFPTGGGALPVMILPTRTKEFFFAPNTGIEYVNFWDDLWNQAAMAVRSCDELVICGYSMPAADQRARQLLLRLPRKDLQVIVSSGGDTQRIVTEYRESGYTRALAAPEVYFEKWVESRASGAAGAA